MSRSMLAQIHIAKKELRMRDSDYRLMLERVTGKNSSGAMTDREQQIVIAEFKRLGWKPFTRTSQKSGWNKPSASGQIRKIWALAKDLDNLGFWELPWRQGLTRLVKKEVGIDHPDWLKPAQANQIIEMLKAISARLKSQKKRAGDGA